MNGGMTGIPLPRTAATTSPPPLCPFFPTRRISEGCHPPHIVSAVRQENRGGTWLDVAVRAGTVQKLEETILAKARDLRRAAIEG